MWSESYQGVHKNSPARWRKETSHESQLVLSCWFIRPCRPDGTLSTGSPSIHRFWLKIAHKRLTNILCFNDSLSESNHDKWAYDLHIRNKTRDICFANKFSSCIWTQWIDLSEHIHKSERRGLTIHWKLLVSSKTRNQAMHWK